MNRLGKIFVGCFFVAASLCALVFLFQSQGADHPATIAFYAGAGVILFGFVVGAAIFIRNVGLLYRKMRRLKDADR